MNTYADAIRQQADDAPRAALPAVASALWRAYAEGHVTEAEAETLAAHIEVRRLSGAAPNGGRGANPTGTPAIGVTDTAQDRQNGPRTRLGSRPRTDASLERRRRWAASGRLPPALAARFTLAEQAVLALVAAETTRRGDCRLAVGHLASMVGVAETTVRNAIREARRLGLLMVEERRLTGFRNDTNVVRIISPEWTAWLRLARKGGLPRHPLPRGGGCKSSKCTPTLVLEQGKSGSARQSRRPAAPSDPSSRETSRMAGARPRRCVVDGAAPGAR